MTTSNPFRTTLDSVTESISPSQPGDRSLSFSRSLGAVALAMALSLSGCLHPGIKALPKQFDVSEDNLKTIAAATADSSTSYDAKSAAQLFEAGVAISDKSLEEFFSSFDHFQQTISHNQTATNIVASTAVGVLGFTGAASKTLGLIGVAQAGANAEFKNFEGVYLLSPTLDVVRKKLTESRRDYAKRLRAENLPVAKTYAQVRAMLVEYHATGSLIAIRGYIRDAANIATFTVLDSNSMAANTSSQIELLTLFNNLEYSVAASPKVAVMDAEVAFLLYLKNSSPALFDTVQKDATVPAAGGAAPNKLAAFGLLVPLANDAGINNVKLNARALAALNRLAGPLGFQKKIQDISEALKPGAAPATPAAIAPGVKSIQVM